MRHTNTYNMLYQLQHVLRSMRFCETQLLEFVADIANTTQKGAHTDILFKNFASEKQQSLPHHWTRSKGE